MNSPNLLSVGGQKAGLNSLYNILEKDLEIAASNKTEVHYFDIDRLFTKGIKWYKEQFSPVNR